MRILVAHNYYQLAGGEDSVFAAECDLLEKHGHHVVRYTRHNDQLKTQNTLQAAGTTLWNPTVYQDIKNLVQSENIQIAHFHNTFPLISPSAYYGARAAGAAVVQTLHNYRLICPNGLLFRDGQPCEQCVGQVVPWAGVRHQCYKQSLAASGAVAALLTTHRLTQTWRRAVDTYIALTPFAREKLIEGGLPASKIQIKPNFIEADPGYSPEVGKYALFVGRLSVEKGIDTLLAAWQQVGDRIPLKIIGDGPLAKQVAAAAQTNPGIEWLGRCSMEEVYHHLRGAMFLVFPSQWYEGLPRTILESFAVGTPVIASALGSMTSLIQPGKTGWHFQPGNTENLADVTRYLLQNLHLLAAARKTTRDEFESHYSPDINYHSLLKIYKSAY